MSVYLANKKLLISKIPNLCGDINEKIAENLSSFPKPIIKKYVGILHKNKGDNDIKKIKKNILQKKNININHQRILFE